MSNLAFGFKLLGNRLNTHKTFKQDFEERHNPLQYRNGIFQTYKEHNAAVAVEPNWQEIADSALRAGYKALGQPTTENPKDALRVGTLQLRHSPVGMDTCIKRWHEQVGRQFFHYPDYLNAVRQAASWRAQIQHAEWSYEEALFSWEESCEKAQDDHEWAERQADRDYEEKYSRWNGEGAAPVRKEVKPLRLPPEPRRKPDLADTEIDFAELYDRQRHTPNRTGFMNYLHEYGAASDVANLLEIPLPAYIREDDFKKHTYFVGITGSGKSEFLKVIIHALTALKNSAVIVLDPSGDFARQIAQWKEFTNNPRLVYLDHTLKSGHVPVMNPFQIYGIRADDYSDETMQQKRVVVEELCATFEQIIANTGVVFHSENMQLVLRECITVLINRPHSNLIDLHEFMSSNTNRELVAFAQSLTHPSLDSTRDFFTNDFVEGFKSTKEAIAGRLRRLRGGALEQMTCGDSTIWLDDLVRQKKIIICNVSKNTGSDYDGPAFGRLMFGMAMSMAKRNAANKKIRPEDRYPCHLIADECHNFICSTVKEVLLEARKYRLMLTLCQQILGNGMPRDIAEVVLSQPHLKLGGKAGETSKAKFADFLGVDRDDYDLGVGEFVISVDGNPKLRIQSRTDLLGDANRDYASIWQLTVLDQVRKYYKPMTWTQEPKTDDVIYQPPEPTEDPPPAPAGKKKRNRKTESEFDFDVK